MVRPRLLKRSSFIYGCISLRGLVPLLLPPSPAQLSTLVLLVSLTHAPVWGFALPAKGTKGSVARPTAFTRSPAQTVAAAPGQKPEPILQAGHTKTINAVAFAPDGRWLASGAKDNTVKIWDTATGGVLRTLYAHSNDVNALAVSPDGKLLASASGDMMDKRDLSTFREGGVVGGMKDNTVRIWEVRTGRELNALRGHELPVGAVAFSDDGRSLTSVSGDAVKVWDVATGRELRSQKTKYEKSGMEKYDSFRSFSIFGKDKKETQQAEWQKDLKRSASKMAVSPNGRLAAVGQPDKGFRIYDASEGRELRELVFKAVPEAESSSLAFSADARLIAYAKMGDTVSVQEAATGRELYSLNTGASKSPQRIRFGGGNRLVTATDAGEGRGVVKLWDAATGQLVRDLAGAGTQGDLRVLSFSHDGRQLATVAPGSKAVRLTDVETGGDVRTLQTGTTDAGVLAAKAAFVKSIDPQTIAGLRERGITTPEQIIDAVEALGAVANEKFQAGDAVSFSPDGRVLISRRMLLKNMTAEAWDMTTGTLVAAPDGAELRDRGKPHFSPDGRYRATPDFPLKDVFSTSVGDFLNFWGDDDWDKMYDQKVQLYDGKSGRKLRDLSGGKAPDVGVVPAVGFSLDGKLLAMTGFEKKERSVLIFETERGRKANGFRINDDEQSGAVTTLCISGDSRLLAAGYATKIDLFDLSTGKTIRTLPHAGRVTSLTFSPDGRFLAALGENNDKYIWDASSGEKLATLVNLGDAFGSRGGDWLVVTPDGLFDGSPAAWKQILWQFGGNTFDVMPAETFFNEFYYPGLLAEVMAGKKPRAPKNITQLDRRQPQVKLTADGGQSGTGATRRNLTVKVEVTEKPAGEGHGAGSGARDVRLFRNDSLVKVWRGDVLKGQASATLEAEVPIVAGENRLTAYAFNRDNVKSGDATMRLTGADSLKRQGTAYVLAVGINSYSNGQYNLKYAVADAEAFAEEVRREQSQLANYGRVEVAPLLNEQATKSNILWALKRLAGAQENRPADAPAALERLKVTQPEDAVFIFFAGHGTARGQRFYLLPHDLGYVGGRTALDAEGLRTILDHSISDEELEDAVEGIDAGKLLLVIDACNSGQALEAEEKRRGPMNSKGLAQLAYEKGMYILTAAQSFQAAQEAAQLGHGLLTYALVEEGLKQTTADRNPKDGEVWAREWFDYASARVPNMQIQKMKQARDAGLNLVFLEGEERGLDIEQRVTQRPRAFYRRESEERPLIIAKP